MSAEKGYKHKIILDPFLFSVLQSLSIYCCLNDVAKLGWFIFNQEQMLLEGVCKKDYGFTSIFFECMKNKKYWLKQTYSFILLCCGPIIFCGVFQLHWSDRFRKIFLKILPSLSLMLKHCSYFYLLTATVKHSVVHYGICQGPLWHYKKETYKAIHKALLTC